MKKLTKILPLAMALMFAGSAFAATAETTNTQNTELTLTVPEFINITQLDSVTEATAEFDANYTTLTASVPMNANFHVITNVPNKAIYLKATCSTNEGEKPALSGTSASALSIAFANTSNKPSASAVQNALTNAPVKADNANAVAFVLTPNIVADATSGAEAPGASYASNVVTYTLKNGAYDFEYALTQAATDGTFSTHDTNGTYTATLTLTDANP